jgi:hypothetical protein
MITDTTGHPFAGSAQWRFTTRGTTDTEPPHVIAVSPANNMVDVNQNRIISVQFSETMDPESFTEGALQLLTGDVTVQGQITYDEQARMLTMTPQLALNAATQYTAVVSTRATDTAQNALPEPYSWQFKTIGPKNTLSITNAGNGNGTVTSTPAGINCGVACESVFDQGTSITLEATAGESSTFLRWSGDACDGASGPCTFTIDSDMAITANFTSGANVHTISTLIVPADGSGGTISPANATVLDGEDISFDIFPGPYYHLAELVVDGQQETPSDSLLFENVTSNHTVQVMFKPNTVQIFDTRPEVFRYAKFNATGQAVWYAFNESETDIYYWDGLFPVNPINISNTSLHGESHPQINARGQVVWENYENFGSEIYLWDASNPSDPINISSNPKYGDHWPQINANGQIVWSGYNGTSTNIYLYDLSNPTIPVNISNSSIFSSHPQINNKNQIVWISGAVGSAGEIFFYDPLDDPATPINISQTPNIDDMEPKINTNGQVVWAGRSESDFEIYFYDASDPKEPVNISNNPAGDDRAPKITESGLVVWAGNTGSDIEIYLWDASDPKDPVNISNNSAGRDHTPDINASGQVVWIGHNGSDHEVYFYDTSSQSYPINITRNPEVHDWTPLINDIGQVLFHVYVDMSTDDGPTRLSLTCVDPCSMPPSGGAPPSGGTPVER